MCILALAGIGFEAARLQVLFAGQGAVLSKLRLVVIAVMGQFFNACIPGATGGDLVKIYYLSRSRPHWLLETASIYAVDRAVSLIGFLVVVLGFAGLNANLIRESDLLLNLVGVALVVSLLLLCTLTVATSPTIVRSRGFSWLQERLPFRAVTGRILRSICAYAGRRSILLRAFLWSIPGHLALAAMLVVAARRHLPAAEPELVGTAGMMAMLANALPLTPGGLGVGEVAFERVFASAGYGGGAILMLTWRVSMLPLVALGAVLYVAGRRSIAGSASVADEGRSPPEK